MFRFKNKKNNHDEQAINQNDLLCRFVVDGSGERIGESVSLDEDIMIVKAKDQYLGIPVKHIEDEGKNLLVKGLVDFDKALELGEVWRQESFKQIDVEDEGK